MIQKDINLLQPRMKQLCSNFLVECHIQGIKVKITETLRSLKRQKKLYKKRLSRTMNSKHLIGLAFDFAPIELNGSIDWNVGKNRKWTQCGIIGKKLGLIWGGTWGWDYTHFEVSNQQIKATLGSPVGYKKKVVIIGSNKATKLLKEGWTII